MERCGFRHARERYRRLPQERRSRPRSRHHSPSLSLSTGIFAARFNDIAYSKLLKPIQTEPCSSHGEIINACHQGSQHTPNFREDDLQFVIPSGISPFEFRDCEVLRVKLPSEKSTVLSFDYWH